MNVCQLAFFDENFPYIIPMNFGFEYESVIGNGRIEIIKDDEKIHALTVLMRNFSSDDTFKFDENMLKAVTVLKLTVSSITGKQLKIK